MTSDTFIALVSAAVFIETVVQAIKPVYDPTTKRFAPAELIAMLCGVMIAVFARLNLLEGFFTTDSQPLNAILYALSGIILGRGPSFVHDLWGKLKTVSA